MEKRMNKNQKGFSSVEILLLIVIIGILCGAGYFVYNSQNTTNTALGDATISESDPKKTVKNNEDIQDKGEETVGWKTYSSQVGQFSFKYPSEWLTAIDPDACEEGIVLLAPTQESLGICGSGFGGQVAVWSDNGNYMELHDLNDGGYKDVTATDITVAGVQGKKYTGVTIDQPDAEVQSSEPIDTKAILYVFYTNEKTYVAAYGQAPDYKDITEDFETMVTKTLTFKP